jgi:hypothetical protein
MKNKEEIIDDVLHESDSQKDREEIETTKSLNLVNFINSQIEKANAKNNLRDDVISKLKAKVSNNEDELPAIVLIRLLEILEKSDNDLTLGMVNIMKDASLIKALVGEKDNEKDNSMDINKEDVDKIKKIANYLDKLNIIEGS